ncbi:conserved hypothetical protein [Xanthomonas oryzae pv. oryzae MAFF 311018]|nr:conserved hypothetical protein [Xanthomonas oryzae pv. oryzae MAFF 311018]
MLWFRADGKQYLVRDPTLLHQMAMVHLRSQQLTDAQVRLAARQQALSEWQAAPAAGVDTHSIGHCFHASAAACNARCVAGIGAAATGAGAATGRIGKQAGRCIPAGHAAGIECVARSTEKRPRDACQR